MVSNYIPYFIYFPRVLNPTLIYLMSVKETHDDTTEQYMIERHWQTETIELHNYNVCLKVNAWLEFQYKTDYTYLYSINVRW